MGADDGDNVGAGVGNEVGTRGGDDVADVGDGVGERLAVVSALKVGGKEGGVVVHGDNSYAH